MLTVKTLSVRLPARAGDQLVAIRELDELVNDYLRSVVDDHRKGPNGTEFDLKVGDIVVLPLPGSGDLRLTRTIQY